MKTPREILLARHRAAEPKLDAIRQEVVNAAADVNRRKPPVQELTFVATLANAIRIPFRELVWPSRRTWAALATVWILIFAVNFSMRDPSPVVARKSPPAAEMIVAWRQQQQLMAELNGAPAVPAEAEREKTFMPKPRTERMKFSTV
jgi:hypothetical protein